jgi:glycosyltransferase involved in cell wall biosynthesis
VQLLLRLLASFLGEYGHCAGRVASFLGSVWRDDAYSCSSPDRAMKPNFASLSIVFPMWNEEELIRSSVDAAREAAEGLVLTGEIGTYEIVIVDDASTDATPQIADELALADPHIRVVHHAVNRKLGGSIKTGFATATGSLVLYTDADLPFDMAELAKAVRLLRIYDADVVSAYRFDRTAEGPLRFVYSYLYNHLVRVALGVRVRDVNFAFKLLRRDLLDRIELRSEGSFIDVELLARAERLGYHIIQFGVDYFPRRRGESTLSSLSVILKIIREMYALGRDLRALRPLPPELRRSTPPTT